MSQENVELLRNVHEAFNREDLQGFLSGWHGEAEYRSAIHQVVEGEAGAFRGHDGLRRWCGDLHDLNEDLATDILEIRDLGERIVVVFVVRGRGKGSGITLETPLAQVIRVGQGKIIEARDYFSREEALEAVLPEE